MNINKNKIKIEDNEKKIVKNKLIKKSTKKKVTDVYNNYQNYDVKDNKDCKLCQKKVE